MRNNRKKRMLKKHKKRKFYIKIIILIFILIIIGISAYKISSKNTLHNPTENQENNLKVESPKNKEIKKEVTEPEIKPEPVKETKSEVLLTFAGDCTLGRDDKYAYENSLPYIFKKNNKDYSYFFKNVYDIFSTDDLTIANLEGTFTSATKKASKSFTFKGPSDYAKILTSGSIEGVNLSNNHIYDYLEKGYKDTKAALVSEKVNYFGEGDIWTTEINGIKLAFLGYRGFHNSKDFQNKLQNDIKSLKNQNYIVIVTLHWGQESHYSPNSTQKNIAHFSIDNGADLIIGHHPHVVQGIEKYKNKIICYSLGNFCFGGNRNPSDKNTMIVQTKFKCTNNTLTSYEVKIIPCSISSVNYMNDYCPTPLTGDKYKALIKKLNELSINLDFKIDGNFHTVTLN
ncbi:CapA family protein [Clostridium aestuarii]|uniref:CapA family protein n=1 Tax=Clostridium aestuarii TaxID=338193 RepID=A0ABT4D1N9_9CLOT|nr:CapA family protein [Clostridium aestuarii]MCY6484552.1 CapA family protein [Clostridium aestuarii]